MAHTNAQIGHGTTITFASGLFANIIDLDWSGISRAAVDSSHMGTTGGKTFVAGATYNPGSLSATIQLDDSTASLSTHAIGVLMVAAAEACTVDFGSAAYSGTAFATDMGYATADEDIITQPITLKFSGDIATVAP